MSVGIFGALGFGAVANMRSVRVRPSESRKMSIDAWVWVTCVPSGSVSTLSVTCSAEKAAVAVAYWLARSIGVG
jgi:hypothetical protein